MKVLIAVDDAMFADEIADFVICQGWPAKTEFRILHVIDWPLESEMHSSQMMDDFLENRYQMGRQISQKVVETIEKTLKDVIVEQEILNGHAAERILNVARGWGADQIIVGSHGRSGLGLFLLGSVSNAIVSNAKCTVTVVRKTDNN